MGLDMYLSKRTFVGFNYEHYRNEDGSVPMTTSGKISHIKPERVSEIIEQVGYWRKANAIHAWFIKNVADGDDDCSEVHVPREKLEELLAEVKHVLERIELAPGLVVNGFRASAETGGVFRANVEEGDMVVDPAVAEEHLPTQKGFFFGSTDYDQWYVEDLKLTQKILEAALTEDEGHASFYYHASW